MVVQEDPDSGLGRIAGVEVPQERNELPAPMFLFHPGGEVAIVKIERGQDRNGSQTLVLVVPRERDVFRERGPDRGRPSPEPGRLASRPR
jgi:hypothetical protein